jgi:hypothetical protein
VAAAAAAAAAPGAAVVWREASEAELSTRSVSYIGLTHITPLAPQRLSTIYTSLPGTRGAPDQKRSVVLHIDAGVVQSGYHTRFVVRTTVPVTSTKRAHTQRMSDRIQQRAHHE